MECPQPQASGLRADSRRQSRRSSLGTVIDAVQDAFATGRLPPADGGLPFESIDEKGGAEKWPAEGAGDTPVADAPQDLPTAPLTSTEKLRRALKCGGLSSHGWLAVRVLVWSVMVLITANHSIVQKWSLTGSAGEPLKSKYCPPTSFFVISILIAVISWVAALATGGKRDLRQCFDIRGILLMAPGALGLVLSEITGLYALKGMSPIVFSLVLQTRLIVIAIVSRLLLKRRIKLVQWTISFALIFSVMSFVFFDDLISAKSGAGGSQNTLEGFLLTIFGYFLGSVFYSVYVDWAMKKQKKSFPVQISQLRLTCVVAHGISVLAIFGATDYWAYGFFGGADGGWDYKVWVMVFFFVFREFVYSFVLKFLDAMWKAFGASLSMSVCYIEDVAIFQRKPFNLGMFMTVLAVASEVASYAVSKLEPKPKEAKQQAAPLATHIQIEEAQAAKNRSGAAEEGIELESTASLKQTESKARSRRDSNRRQ
eukprot:GHVT01071753.1.p1 GENE.GHVT01071753.1~~GHVT01071753.1.p1  ORF type:complete len:483 (-),score=91.47 GHVT01071753.1:1203-2651(-)